MKIKCSVFDLLNLYLMNANAFMQILLNRNVELHTKHTNKPIYNFLLYKLIFAD